MSVQGALSLHARSSSRSCPGRGASLLAVALLLLLLFAGCNRAPLPVGFAGPLTGLYSDLGVAGRNGAQLALEEINAAGGCAGRSLELVARDDRNAEETARRVTRELIEEDVVAIVGHMTSGASVAALPVARQHGTVLLSPTSSTPALSRQKDVFYRVWPSTGAAATALGRYAAEEMDLGTAVTVWDEANEAYARPFNRAFVEGFRGNGGAVGAQLSFSGSAEVDWDGLAQRVVAAQPEGVLLVASARDTARCAQLLAQRGLEAQIFSSGWGTTDEVMSYGGRFVEGMIAARATAETDTGEKAAAFQSRYQERFGRSPSFVAAAAYDAVRILCAALERTGGSPDGLGDAITETEEFPGVHGPITIDEYGDRAATVVIVEASGGSFVERHRIGGGDGETD